jgi:hypothetical protein
MSPSSHHIELEHATKLLGRGPHEGRALRPAGIRDQNIDRSALRRRPGDRSDDRALIGDIREHIGLGVPGRYRFAQRLLMSPKHRHGGSIGGERRGDRAADPASAAGHEGMLALQSWHRALTMVELNRIQIQSNLPLSAHQAAAPVVTLLFYD